MNIIFFSPEIFFSRLTFSFFQAFIVSVLSIFFGGGLAYLILKYSGRTLEKLFDWLMLAVVFLPAIIVASGFILVWGRSGCINSLLQMTGMQIKITYTFVIIILAHLYYNIPLAYIILKLRFSSLNKRIHESAQVAGASAGQILRYITLPAILPSIVSTMILIFLFCVLSFNIPLILGGIKWQTLEVYIYKLIVQDFNYFGALQAAVLQFFLISAILFFFLVHLKQTPEKTVLSSYPKKKSLGFIITGIVQIFFGLFILLPVFAVFAKGADLQVIAEIIKSDFLFSAVRSFFLAISTIFISIFLAVILLYLSGRTVRLTYLLLAVSPILIGAIILVILGPSYQSALLAYIIVMLPVSYYLLFSHYSLLPASFRNFLQILGADRKKQFAQTVSYMRPSIIRVSALGSVYVLGDLAISSILMPADSPTAMHMAYRMIGAYRFAEYASAMSLILFLIGASVYVIFSFDRKI